MTTLKITALGGLGETGARNCMLYETERTAVLVDCGVGFPDNRHPGVELIHCNYDFLEEKVSKLKAVVLTHGHEDHVGGLPFLLRRFPVPVYATPFTQGIVRLKFKEFGIGVDILDIEYGELFSVGDIEFEPVFINHSIMDVAAFCISTGSVKAFHCTDFKIDQSAPEGRATDLKRFRELGEEGIDLLLLDSTNALVSGWTQSEMKIRENLIQRFTRLKGRVLACLFSSNGFRVQTLIECARITGRKVALTGRSTKEYFAIAKRIQRMDTTGVEFYDVEDITQFPDNEILVLVTGSQAEPRSVWHRMSKNMFRPFRLKTGDTLLMTSKMIPGNEGKILDQLNRLALLGVKIIDERMKPAIHASGHAKEEELREVMRVMKPKGFMPIHGEYRALSRHAEIAHEEGLSKERTVVVLNGQTVELTPEGPKLGDQRDMGLCYVSENTDYEITEEAIRRRNKMSWNGLVTVSAIFDHMESAVRLPLQVFSEGIFGGVQEALALDQLKTDLEEKLQKERKGEVEKIYKFLKIEVRRFYKSQYQIRPEVVVLIHEV